MNATVAVGVPVGVVIPSIHADGRTRRGGLAIAALTLLLPIVGCGEADEAASSPGATGKDSGEVSGQVSSDVVGWRLAWRFESQPIDTSDAGKLSQFHMPPLLTDDAIYVGDFDGRLYRLPRTTAEAPSPRWVFRTPSGAGFDTPLLLHDGVLYAGDVDGTVYAIDPATGKQTWRFRTRDTIMGGFTPTTVAGEPAILLASKDERVYAVRRSDGKELWSFAADNYFGGRPQVVDDRVIVGGCDGNLYVLDRDTGEQIRAIAVNEHITCTPAIDGDLAVVGHYGNRVVGIEWRAGDIRWQYRYQNFAFASDPLIVDGVVFIGGRDGNVHAIEVATGEGRWRRKTGGHVDAGPTLAAGHIAAASKDGRLYWLDRTSGAIRWQFDTGSELLASAAWDGELLAVAGTDGNLYAFSPVRADATTSETAGRDPPS